MKNLSLLLFFALAFVLHVTADYQPSVNTDIIRSEASNENHYNKSLKRNFSIDGAEQVAPAGFIPAILIISAGAK